jgi:putative peptidoglycan lipid II flippase
VSRPRWDSHPSALVEPSGPESKGSAGRALRSIEPGLESAPRVWSSAVSSERGAAAHSGRNAAVVAAGILASRIFGLLKQTLFAHVFGTSVAAGVFAAAQRIPNFLQNLLGEGTLSASFIPVYAGFRSRGEDPEADEVASGVFGLLVVALGILTITGVVFAPQLVWLLAPGFEGEARELTVTLVRILFPGTGVLVLSAWCLGILNSHRRFFLSYSAPVVSNLVMIAALWAVRDWPSDSAVRWLAWAFGLGSVLQMAVQVPQVLRLLGRFRPKLRPVTASVLEVVRGFVPTVAARGVVQISGWADTAYATLISPRALATLTSAQTISLLPVSLFAVAISAAELPDLSSEATQGHEERGRALRARLGAGLERMAFFVVPSAAAFLAAGDAMAAVLFQSGQFNAADTRYVWYILAGSGVGLLAQTSGRLYASVFYALKDTTSPFRIAVLRVTLGVGVGYWAVRILPGQLGLPMHLGAVFVTLTSGVTAWLEVTLLRRRLQQQLGSLPSVRGRLAVLWTCAAVAAAVTLAAKAGMVATWGPMAGQAEEWMGGWLPLPALPGVAYPHKVAGAVLLVVFGLSYFSCALVAGVPQARAVLERIGRKRRGS